MRSLALLVALAFGTTLSAQQASYTYIDQPSGPVPWLTALNTPKIGTSLVLQVPNSRFVVGGYSLYYLLTGLSNPNLDLAALFPGQVIGILFSSAEVVLPTPLGPLGGSSTMSLPIPNDASLLGFTFYQQILSRSATGIIGSPTTNPAVLSRGGQAVIGL